MPGGFGGLRHGRALILLRPDHGEGLETGQLTQRSWCSWGCQRIQEMEPVLTDSFCIAFASALAFGQAALFAPSLIALVPVGTGDRPDPVWSVHRQLIQRGAQSFSDQF